MKQEQIIVKVQKSPAWNVQEETLIGEDGIPFYWGLVSNRALMASARRIRRAAGCIETYVVRYY